MLKKLLLATAITFLPLSVMAATPDEMPCNALNMKKVQEDFHIEYVYYIDATHVINIWRQDKHDKDGNALVIVVMASPGPNGSLKICGIHNGMTNIAVEKEAKKARDDSDAGKFDTPTTDSTPATNPPTAPDAPKPAGPSVPMTDMPKGDE